MISSQDDVVLRGSQDLLTQLFRKFLNRCRLAVFREGGGAWAISEARPAQAKLSEAFLALTWAPSMFLVVLLRHTGSSVITGPP